MKVLCVRTALFSVIILLKTTVYGIQGSQTPHQHDKNNVNNAKNVLETELNPANSLSDQYKENCDFSMESANGDCGIKNSHSNPKSGYLKNWNEEDKKRKDASSTSRVGTDTDKEETCNSLALVPFDESSILPHQQRERSFTFAGHDINIQQDWGGLGVAAVVWDAAVVLGEYLEQHRHIVEGKRVIELGSGTGLAGLVASFLGGHVTVTERQEALDFLHSTVEKNLPPNSSYKINIAELDWTKPLDNFTDHYDVILGADIIYVKDTFDDLYRTLVRLTSPDTLLLVSCKIRYDRDTEFLDILKKDFVLKQDLYDKKRDIYIYSIRKKMPE